MSQADTVNVMNRLLTILYRSLPMYLHEAQPWHSRRELRTAGVLQNIVEDQLGMAQRIAGFILDLGSQPNPAEYPDEFTDANWHFVGLKYLLEPLVEHQARDVQRLEDCVAQLSADVQAQSLAKEALGLARGHLESLEALAAGEELG